MSSFYDTGKEFIRAIPASARVALIMDTDADGLSGARIIEYLLQTRGIMTIPLFPGKAEWAFSESTVDTVRRHNPDFIIAVDTGSGAYNPYSPVPTLIIDHHVPYGSVPSDAVFCSSYGRQPTETASLIAFLIAQEITDISLVEWLVLLGVIGDLGDTRAFSYLEPLAKKYTKTHTRKAVGLINAARRSSACDARTAYEALKSADSPRAITEGNNPYVAKLRQYKEEFDAELEHARHARPYFTEKSALIVVHSACLVHGIIASIWAGKLSNSRVLVANTGYISGEIVFSFRTRREENLIEYLHDCLDSLAIEGSYGYGHERATGGRMSTGSFKKLLEGMKFPQNIIENIPFG